MSNPFSNKTKEAGIIRKTQPVWYNFNLRATFSERYVHKTQI